MQSRQSTQARQAIHGTLHKTDSQCSLTWPASHRRTRFAEAANHSRTKADATMVHGMKIGPVNLCQIRSFPSARLLRERKGLKIHRLLIVESPSSTSLGSWMRGELDKRDHPSPMRADPVRCASPLEALERLPSPSCTTTSTTPTCPAGSPSSVGTSVDTSTTSSAASANSFAQMLRMMTGSSTAITTPESPRMLRH